MRSDFDDPDYSSCRECPVWETLFDEAYCGECPYEQDCKDDIEHALDEARYIIWKRKQARADKLKEAQDGSVKNVG